MMGAWFWLNIPLVAPVFVETRQFATRSLRD